MMKKTDGEIHTYFDIKVLRLKGFFDRRVEIEAEGKIINLAVGDVLTLTKHTKLGDD